MKRRVLTLLTAAAVCLSAGAVCLSAGLAWGQVRVDLAYQDFKDASDPLAGLGRRWTSRLGTKPPVKGVPGNLSEKAAYFRVQMSGKRVLFVVDPANPAGPGDPAKLYVDSDIDLDLSDETAVTGEKLNADQWRFGPLAVKGDDGTELRFAVLTYIQRGSPTHAMLVAPGSRTGTAKLGGTEYKVALVDGDLDGRYTVSPSGSPDILAVDLDQDGRFETDAFEVMPIAALARLGGAYYDVSVEADGSAITFESSKLPLGTLSTGNSTVEVTLSSAVGRFFLERTDGSWQVPAGVYTISGIRLSATDKDGKLWSLDSLQVPPRVARVTIEEGKETVLKLGPPLTFRTDVTSNGRNVSVDLSLTDGAGVPYLSGATKDGQRLQPPKMRILDENGKELHTAAFSYG